MAASSERQPTERGRTLVRVLAPSTVLLAVAVVGQAFGTYWQYVLAISITAAVIGSALAMLVGYARCITIATGAMMAIGAYGAAVLVLQARVPFLLACVAAALLLARLQPRFVRYDARHPEP